MVEYYRETPVFSVSELSELLDRELERSFRDIWVEGEVSNYTASSAGHLYFRLKDGGSVLKAAIFRQSAIRLPFKIDNGMVLLLRGRLGYYGKSGELQIYASHAEPYGVGALQMALEQAKKRLQADGLTDPSRKRKIPPFPKKIGIVTSPEGAAVRDIISILARRGAPFEIIISPSIVQGDQAPARLKAATERLFKAGGIDLIILTRGGGSFEDLNAFNDESLARLIAASPVPVISAVGHEIDTVLTDLTADLRAPTPSAAAEIISQPSVEVRARLSSIMNSACSRAANRLALAEEKLGLFDAEREGRSFIREIERMEERRDRAFTRLSEKTRGRIGEAVSTVAFLNRSLHPGKLLSSLSISAGTIAAAQKELLSAITKTVTFRENAVAGSLALLDARNPLSILSKGYSIIKDDRGAVISDSSQVEAGQQLSAVLRRGKLIVSVDSKE